MRPGRTRAVARRVAPRRRCAGDAFACGRSVRLAATTRPAMTRAALLGGVWLGALAAVATDGAHAQQGPFLYVPESSGAPPGVTVIDTSTNTTVPPAIVVQSQPQTAAVRGDESMVYVTNFGGNSVSVINTGTNAVVATINLGASPTGVAVSPDGTRAYVTQNGSSVSVINTATNTVVTTLNGFNSPRSVAVSPDGTRAYVTNPGVNTVSVIDTATNTVVNLSGSGFNSPVGVVFSPDGTRAYVTNQIGGTVSVIDTATNTVLGPIPAGNAPNLLGICSNGNALLASGLTFKANTSGALACTLASGPSGASGPVFTGGTLQIAGANIASALPITLQSQGGTIDTNG